MRPQLLLRGIRDLHDARYCSAVGIYLLAFELAAGHPRRINPALVREIMPWLSGPESIGDFGDEPVGDILALASGLNLNRVSVPLALALDPARAQQLPAGWIIRITDRALSPADLPVLHELLSLYPDTCAEFVLENDSIPSTQLTLFPAIVERGILHCPDPDAIYEILKKQGLQPWAFALGDFVHDDAGLLDYERCDHFVETYASLLPA